MCAPRSSLVPRVVAMALAYEVANSVSWISRIVSFAAAYDATVFVMVGLRAAVTALQASAAWQLWGRLPAGRSFGPASLLASAILLMFELGARLAPSSLPPGQRGIVIAGYTAYAVAVSWILRRSAAHR